MAEQAYLAAAQNLATTLGKKFESSILTRYGDVLHSIGLSAFPISPDSLFLFSIAATRCKVQDRLRFMLPSLMKNCLESSTTRSYYFKIRIVYEALAEEFDDKEHAVEIRRQYLKCSSLLPIVWLEHRKPALHS